MHRKWKYIVVTSLVLTGIAFGLTKTSSLWIVNSQIDSTPIGNNTPSNATFTNAVVGNGFSIFSMAPGTTAPVRRGLTWGLDPAGDVTIWANSAQTGSGLFVRNSSNSATWGSIQADGYHGALNTTGGIMSGTYTGGPLFSVASITTLNAGGGNLNGTYAGTRELSGSTTIDGGTLNGNYNGNPTFTGTITANTFTAPTLNISGTATFTNTIIGNASTASAFNHTPIACGSGTHASGIIANGNAVCVSDRQIITGRFGATCSVGGTGNSCTTPYAWPNGGFTDTAYTPSCIGVNASSTDTLGAVIDIVGISPSGITIRVTSQQGSGSVQSFGGVDCIAVHD